MDLIKFDPPSGSPFTVGKPVNGWSSVRWTERHIEAGDFEIQAPLSSGLRNFLEIGSFVTHVDSTHVMMVEDHQIEQATDEDPTLVVTGRDVRAFFENRIVGQNQAAGTPAIPPAEYILSAQADPGLQIYTLICQHILNGVVTDVNDALPFTEVTYTAYAEDVSALTLERQTLYVALTNILKQRDYGLSIERLANGNVRFKVHYGTDKSGDVMFSWRMGDFDSLQYLFSNRNLKNTAIVQGRWVTKVVTTGATSWDRRTMYVDASDLDEAQTEAPTGGTLTTIQDKMEQRGLAALLAQIDLNLAQFDISADTQYRYRRDYNLGDLVSVRGDFGGVEVRRVTEHTEIDDGNGETSHPTLSQIVVKRS